MANFAVVMRLKPTPPTVSTSTSVTPVPEHKHVTEQLQKKRKEVDEALNFAINGGNEDFKKMGVDTNFKIKSNG